MGKRGPQPGTVQKLPPHDTITEGDAIGVLLSNRSARVWLHPEDFARIVEAYGNRAWSWIEAARYVRLRADQTMSVPVARLVVGEGGRFIRYADGDRLNLRRENLSVEDAVRPGARVERSPSNPARKTAALPSKPMHRPSSIHLPNPLPSPAKVMIAKPVIPVVAAVKRPRIAP